MASELHQTVLLKEAVNSLVTNRRGRYADCTYGRGGHSQAIVNQLDPDGQLLVIDRDESAIAHAHAAFDDDPRVIIQQGPFSAIRTYLKDHQIESLDGVLLDLGVSSPQLDNNDRGFSFSRNGPLDMRMDQTVGMTAAQWLADAGENEITDVLKRYGEERFARRIARKIIEARAQEAITTTNRLVELIEAAIPRREKNKHPATRTFQAIRIHVNQELAELENFLQDLIELLNSGGRIVIISFHSLEDRVVKRFFRLREKGEQLPSRLPIRDVEVVRKLRVLGKPVRASEAEISENVRARSSIMRIAEKI